MNQSTQIQQKTFRFIVWSILLSSICLVKVSAQTPASSSNTTETKTLTLGQPIEDELSGNQTHCYQFSLTQGQFVKINVLQSGVAVKVALLGPNGNVLEEGGHHGIGVIEVYTIADATGAYGFTISLVKPNTAGRYKVTMETLRAATPNDFKALKTENLFAEGLMTSARNTRESLLQAIATFEQALSLSREIGDLKMEAACLNNIGLQYIQLGDRQKALEYNLRALQPARVSGDRSTEAGTLNNIGSSYKNLGEFQKSIDYFEKGLALSRAMGDASKLVTSLTNMGNLYLDVGETQTALYYYQQALDAHRNDIGNLNNKVMVINQIGLIYEEAGDVPKALEHYEQALSIVQSNNLIRPHAFCVFYIGRAYAGIGDKEKAFDFLQKALALSRTAGDRPLEAYTLDQIGLLQASTNEIAKAIESFDLAISLSREIRNKLMQATILNHKARVLRNVGQIEQARANIEESLSLIESLRAKIGSPGLRASYLARVQDYYELAVDILTRLHQQNPSGGYDKLALQTSERARARALIELLAEGQINIREGISPELLKAERDLLQQFDARAEALSRLSSKRTEQIAAIQKELEELRAQYQKLQADIRATSPRYASLVQPSPLTAQEIQQNLLDADTMLLEYSLGKERSYLFAVTQDSIKTFELPKREEIEKAAREVYELLTARNKTIKFETRDEKLDRVAQADAAFGKAANKLVQLVLAPASKALTKKRLLIVPDGPLQYVPFAALPGSKMEKPTQNSELPLILNHEIVMLPSASTLAVLRKEAEGRTPAPKTVAVLADPVFEKDDERFKVFSAKMKHATNASPNLAAKVRSAETKDFNYFTRAVEEAENTDVGFQFARLPFTRKEAQAIGRLVPVSQNITALDFSATRSMALNPELSKYRIVHFATHGFISTAHPELSGIVLSLFDEHGKPQDGFLRADNIYNLNLPADLIVLSGCRTGLGKEIRGEGLIGLTRGFMYAGAARVAVSLWDVHDEATAELMTHFYHGMIKEKLSPAAALRRAQVSMMKEKRWSSPYYWSSFILQGEPR